MVNFLEGKPRVTKAESTRRSAAFFHVLKSAETVGLLDAHHIFVGFEEEELIEIFNETSRRLRLSYKAFPLACLLNADFEKLTSVDLVRRVTDGDGAAIVLRHGDEHWVLAYGISESGKIQIADSGHNPKYRKSEVIRLANKSKGVALLPKRSSLLRNINAQTH